MEVSSDEDNDSGGEANEENVYEMVINDDDGNDENGDDADSADEDNESDDRFDPEFDGEV